MKPEEIVVGGVYESESGRRRRTVIFFEMGSAPAMTRLLYVSGNQDPDTSRSFTWLNVFARWAEKRIDVPPAFDIPKGYRAVPRDTQAPVGAKESEEAV